MKKLIVFALILTIQAVSPVTVSYAASLQPSVMTEVEAELHPPNEVQRELHLDRYKGHTGGGDPSRIPDYGRTPTY